MSLRIWQMSSSQIEWMKILVMWLKKYLREIYLVVISLNLHPKILAISSCIDERRSAL